MMQPGEKGWVYASLTVWDGQRKLKPTHVGYDRLRFAEPPRLTSEQVELVIVNGDEESRQMAIVLPHDPDATRIPIRLVAGSLREGNVSGK
ncbi:MAG TPA: hypothetical protein VG269_18375 [Tepidisphaeraceae bacterium]|jgi:hypothetical protein|nr:hypothetical protein [Tepidisphaeraceae bacterium]